MENMNIFFAEKNSIEKRRRKYLQNENCFGRADEKLRRKRRKIFGEGKNIFWGGKGNGGIFGERKVYFSWRRMKRREIFREGKY